MHSVWFLPTWSPSGIGSCMPKGPAKRAKGLSSVIRSRRLRTLGRSGTWLCAKRIRQARVMSV